MSIASTFPDSAVPTFRGLHPHHLLIRVSNVKTPPRPFLAGKEDTHNFCTEYRRPSGACTKGDQCCMHTDHGIASTASAFSMSGIRSVICSAPQIPGGRIMGIGIIESSRRALRPRSARPSSSSSRGSTWYQNMHCGAGEGVTMMENLSRLQRSPPSLSYRWNKGSLGVCFAGLDHLPA